MAHASNATARHQGCPEGSACHEVESTTVSVAYGVLVRIRPAAASRTELRPFEACSKTLDP
jgi:hypothetical protein